MKIIHTSDWHLGKKVRGFSMLEDQRFVLEQFFEEVGEIKPDIVLISGDFYDQALADRETVQFADEMLTRMAKEWPWPVLIISGNHDSPERLTYAKTLYAKENVFLYGFNTPVPEKFVLNDVEFFLLPFARPNTIKTLYQEEWEISYTNALKRQLQAIKENWDPHKKHVVLYHGFVVQNQQENQNEGTVDSVSSSLFDGFDYVALGHLHGQYPVTKDHRLYYSGSLLKYSEREAKQAKGYLEVELGEGVNVLPHPLHPKRDLRVLRDTFENLLKGKSEDYMYFELEDPLYGGEGIPDAMNRLRRRYPNAMGLSYLQEENDPSLPSKQTLETLKTQTPFQLFERFFEEQKHKPLNSEQREWTRNQLEGEE